ncbi:hypothetical protein LTR91_016711 [Friedmanniomyces endolithicus]|uniref:Uncharacterized protein n=1 Tax=Friedmanniomyces endolithicus TaxID=329885 RepID=A0AAN6K7K3_9PEZI|nr:hypothetical protein LTR57_023957 [Friedmanniomyces endolithicus]KAK0968453.1 hypothetical protein LTR91_016711 [Friedmanniomyces endolithicus]KAK0989956.1 hypothetical protein LTS01_008746 [Friedmanniomyces endolithicus]KAK1024415.1 hypothetical protein LTS16_024079 [Friedmanniomyces endolithicus]
MADADGEKAEKLATAKKRFEQLKKEQAKKGKKTATKKKEDKSGALESKADDVAGEEAAAAAAAPVTEASETLDAAPEDERPAEGGENDAARPLPERQPSVSMQSRQRSESFRQGGPPAIATDLKAGGDPLSPGIEVQDLYKKQAARIEELERENGAYKVQQEEGAARLAKAEEELDGLREGSSGVAELRSRAKDAERLGTELAAAQRQLAQVQTAKSGNRRVSGAGPDFGHELASKTSTIETLELELSNIRSQLLGLQSMLSERNTSIQDIEDRSKATEAVAENYRQELEQLKVSMAFPSDETKEANDDPEALTKRITVLESDLRTANSSLGAAQHRASSLEQKIEALTKMHRDASQASTAARPRHSDRLPSHSLRVVRRLYDPRRSSLRPGWSLEHYRLGIHLVDQDILLHHRPLFRPENVATSHCRRIRVINNLCSIRQPKHGRQPFPEPCLVAQLARKAWIPHAPLAKRAVLAWSRRE